VRGVGTRREGPTRLASGRGAGILAGTQARDGRRSTGRHMERERLLREVKARLAAAFGERLKGVILYGSEARGAAEPDSDIDFLVLLDGPVDHLGRRASG